MEMYLDNHFLANGIVILIPILLFLLFLLFFNKKGGFEMFVRYIMLPFTLFGGFSVYMFGYQFGKSGWDVIPNALEAFFSTGRLFILGNDLVEVSCIKETVVFHACFSLVAASAVFVFISVVLNVFFKNRLLRCIIKLKKFDENHIFIGISHAALSLSQDLKKEKEKRLVVFIKDIDTCEDHTLFHQLKEPYIYVVKRQSLFESIHLEKEEGIAHINSGGKSHSSESIADVELFHNLNVIKRKMIRKKSHLYFLSEDEDRNLFMAQKAIEEMKEWPIKESVKIHVRTFSESTNKLYFNWAKFSQNKITVKLHNHSAIIARQLVDRHHPVDSIEVNNELAIANSNFNALIIGFGLTGTLILRKLIEQGQFVGSKFNATVIDKAMNQIEGRFGFLYPGAISNYNLDFIGTEVGQAEFYKIVSEKIKSLNYIVICLGDDKLNMQTAQDIHDLTRGLTLGKFKILVQIKSNSLYQNFSQKLNKDFEIFGRDIEIYTEDVIVQGLLESRARNIHQVYGKKFDLTETYDELTQFKQLSNISSAEHLRVKLKLIDFTEELVKSYKNQTDFLNNLTEVQKRNLACCEHLRWNAFHFSNGWNTLYAAELPKIPVYKDRQNEVTRKHACLVSWDELVPLSDILKKDLQQLDMDTIEYLYDFITENKSTNNEKHTQNSMTQSIKDLSPEIKKMIEPMAQNVHNCWMAGRIAEGWQYGPNRDDEKKEHPGIVSYEKLSEEEKEYDRQTVKATLSYLIENGYEIRKKE